MPDRRRRFVSLCQHLLALGTVVAILAPASSVVTLDIVAPTANQGAGRPRGSWVATAPVVPTVREVRMPGLRRGAALRPSTDPAARRRLAARTAPQRVHGLATIGVTWRHGVRVLQRDITISVRTRKARSWSGWERVPYDVEHGPDPGSAEA